MSLKLNSSGGGSVTLQEPSTASNVTLDLPAVAGTVMTTATAVAKTQMYAGAVLQVVTTSFNPAFTNTTSTSYVNSGLSLGITLSSASNRVLVLVNGGHCYVDSGYPNGLIETICRQSSTTYNSANDLGNATYGMSQTYNSTNLNTTPHSMHVLDTAPGSTTPTYRVFFRSRFGGSVVWQEGASFINMTLLEIAV